MNICLLYITVQSAFCEKRITLNNSFIAKKLSLLAVIACLLCQSVMAYPQTASEITKGKLTNNIAQSVKISTPDDFQLVANYYAGENNRAGVLLLHGCEETSIRYANLAKKITNKGIHTLALDLRGFGESRSEVFSHDNIKKKAKDIISYQNDVAALTSYWELDILTAFNYLRTKVNKQQGISVVAVGCSSVYAIALAEKMRLSSMVFITPKMTYSGKERYKNLIDIPSYFISSSRHIETFQTAKELFEWNGSDQSTFQIFKNDGYDYNLLRRNAYLLDDISAWLKTTLEP